MKLYLIAGIAFAAITAALWHTVQKNGELKARHAQAVQAFDTYAANAQAEAVETNQAMAELQAGYQAARDDAHAAQEVFNRHDLETLVKEKPGLVVARANAAYDRLFSAIEAASRGAPRALETTAAGRGKPDPP